MARSALSQLRSGLVVPRNTLGSVRGTIVPFQNFITNSEDYSGYVQTEVTPTYNAIANPFDGSINATKFVDNAALNNHRIYGNAITMRPFLPYCFSLAMKDDGRRYGGISVDIGFGGNHNLILDLQNGSIASLSSISGAALQIRADTVENLGNGWYRMSLILVIDRWTTIFMQGVMSNNGSAIVYTGNGSGLYMSGFQCVQANWKGPYKKTTGATSNPNGKIRDIVL